MNQTQSSRSSMSHSRKNKKKTGARTRSTRAREKNTCLFSLLRRDSSPQIKQALVRAFARQHATLTQSGIPVGPALMMRGLSPGV